MRKRGFVYIITNQRNGTLYIGVTSDLVLRISQHKAQEIPGFSKVHSLTLLVWYEEFPDIESAIYREKQMKEWKRLWKLRAIEEMNPEWSDLYNSLLPSSAD